MRAAERHSFKMAKKVLISTICMNRKDGLEQMLQALYNGSDKADFDLILTNQNSHDGTGEVMDRWAAEQENIRVFHEPENSFFQRPGNRAYKIAAKEGYENLLLMNDDLVPIEGFLNPLLKPFASDKKIGITGPQGTCNQLNDDFNGEGGSRAEYIEGSCMMINIERCKPFLGANLFDTNLEGIYAEDSCLSLFIQEKGLKVHQVPLYLEHYRSQTTMHGDPAIRAQCEAYQAANHAYCLNRWRYYLDRRTFKFPIVLSRRYAIGDCILLTPIIRAIKASNPLSEIYIETDFPQVFTGNPHVRQVSGHIKKMPHEMRIDLQHAYEDKTNIHIVEGYYEEVKKHLPGIEMPELRTDLYPNSDDILWASNLRRELGGEKLVLIHAGPTTWESKNWHPDNFAQLATRLVLDGWTVAAVGAQDKPPQLTDCIDLTYKSSIPQLAALCKQADLFIGVDSGPYHIAQSSGVRSIGIFGITSSRYITTNGGPHMAAESDPKITSTGERHRTTNVEHLNLGTEAINSVTVDQVMENVRKLFI